MVSFLRATIKLKSFIFTRTLIINRLSTTNISQKVNSQNEEIDLNTPIKYSTSPAFKWHAKHTRIGRSTEARLWYEPYVILASITAFLIYFTILRQENDVDEKLKMSLYDRVKGLEEHQLRQSLQYNLDNGLKTDDIVQRLKEIEETQRKNSN